MNKTIVFIGILSLLYSCAQKDKKVTSEEGVFPNTTAVEKRNDAPFHINLDQDFPNKRIRLQDIADVKYIKLQSSNDVLLDNTASFHISDSCIIACNSVHDFLVFDTAGNIKTHFNHTGGGGEEYSSYVFGWIYDDRKNELFVLDRWKKILVYSNSGKFKRKLVFQPNYKVDVIFNYDENTLLAHRQNNLEKKQDRTRDGYDYVFLSKHDGTIVSTVNIRQPNSMPLIKKEIVVFIPSKCIVKDGQDYIITDHALDTVYQILNNKQLIPFLIREPSVFKTSPSIFLDVFMKTDRYVFFLKTIFDNDSAKPRGLIDIKDLVLDMKTNEVTSLKFYNADFPKRNLENQSLVPNEIGKNMGARTFEAFELIEAYKKGELNGPLKEIASTLNEDDNPVLMILRFK